MIRYDLRGKAAIVTGAASGIGLATATILAEAGARVALNFLPGDGRGRESVERLEADGRQAIEAPGNVAVPVEAETMIQTAIEDLGRLDLLVNNAGTPATRRVIPPAALDVITEDLWEAGGGGAEIEPRRRGQYRLDRRIGLDGKQPRLLGIQGRPDQSHKEPGTGPCAGGARQCCGAGLGR